MSDAILRNLIPGFDTHYADGDGNIWSDKPSGWKKLTPYPVKGYLTVRIRNRKYAVHRLVCLAFHGEPPAGMEACHEDGIKANCSSGNLYWGTHQENYEDLVRHGKSGLRLGSQKGEGRVVKLSVERRGEIVAMKDTGVSQTKVAKMFGVSQGTVWKLWTDRYCPVPSRSEPVESVGR